MDLWVDFKGIAWKAARRCMGIACGVNRPPIGSWGWDGDSYLRSFWEALEFGEGSWNQEMDVGRGGVGTAYLRKPVGRAGF